MTVKERLHRIVDEMSDREAALTLERLAGRRADPLARLLDAAAEDDEPLTDEEAAAIRDGYDELDAGQGISLAELRRELG
jgi:hypothetical protein